MNVSRKRGRSRTRSPAAKRKASPSFNPRAPAVLQIRRAEKRAVDVPQTSMDFDSTGSLTLLNGIIPGDGLQNRQGRQIAMQNITLRFFITKDKPGNAPKSDFLRLLLVYDRQANAAAPTVGTILNTIDNAGASTSTSLSAINLSNPARFQILRDWHWGIPDAALFGTGDTGATTLSASQICGHKIFVNLKGLETHFNTGTAGTVADITTGALYLVAFGQNANIDSQWQVTFVSRIRFTD